jgi:large subunit ribosomal protein L6
MSRVGIKPIPVPGDVKVNLDGQAIKVKGPLGELNHTIPRQLKVKYEENTISVHRDSDDRIERSLHGLTRTLIANMVEGVSKGFERKLIVDGVGYKAQAKGDQLILNVGFSHPIEYKVPKGITAKVERNVVIIKGFDKQQVGQTAAIIRDFRKVEPYKGKGIRYDDEVVRRKVGKVGT